ncbi:hypothetical protein GCM10017562_59850 [Streptomyces roseofulvus]|uniref:hypothetical protein n=1 Tax=Streptomyces roseofulvus TaxID=33902 RepID=UPI0031FC3616
MGLTEVTEHRTAAAELGDYLDSFELLQLRSAVPALLDELLQVPAGDAGAGLLVAQTALAVRPAASVADALNALSEAVAEAGPPERHGPGARAVAGLLGLLAARSGRVPAQRAPVWRCRAHAEDGCQSCDRADAATGA